MSWVLICAASVFAGASAFFAVVLAGRRAVLRLRRYVDAGLPGLDASTPKAGRLSMAARVFGVNRVAHPGASGAGGRRRAVRRSRSIEAHVPELAETVAMGLRAGLPFERAFCLYGEKFDDELSAACLDAYRVWASGLATKSEALAGLASESESVLLERFCKNAIRSFRFGGSLAQTFSLIADEGRAKQRADAEERIAKVPVKMMIPTAVLILPAMLIVVMGPVLLGAMA